MAEHSEICPSRNELAQQNEACIDNSNTTREDPEHADQNNGGSENTPANSSKENTPVVEGMREAAPSPTGTPTTDTIEHQPVESFPAGRSSHDSSDPSMQAPRIKPHMQLVSTHDFSDGASKVHESIFGNGPNLNTEVTIVGSKVRKNPNDDHGTESKRVKTNGSSESTPNPANSKSSNPIAALVVGPQQQIVLCEKDKLVQYSKYFNDGFGSGFFEGNTSAMVFPDERSDTVTAYVTWAYSEYTQLPGGDGPLLSNISVYLYCFAEQIQCIKLKNQLIEQLYVIIKKQFLNPRGEKSLGQIKAYLTPHAINYAMGRLPGESSPLLRLLASFFNFRLAPEKLKDWPPLEQYPASFRLLAYHFFFSSGCYAGKAKFPRIRDLLERL